MHNFTYRYAVHRAGVFYRWEEPTDGPAADELHPPVKPEGDNVKLQVDPLQMNMNMEGSSAENPDLGLMDTVKEDRHEVPLHLLSNRETYIVNDVLGLTTIPPDIDHVRLPSRPTYTRASTLHSHHHQNSSKDLSGQAAGSAPSPAGGPRKKHVAFAPMPQTTYSQREVPKQTVHLNSTDGLVVVSAFLPIILHRSPAGEWSAVGRPLSTVK